jgi:hypothetical protein
MFAVPDGVMVLEPRDVYDAAIVGFRSRKGVLVAVYSRSKCISALQAAHAPDGWTKHDAVEWFEYNVDPVWMGPGAPVYRK